MSSTTKNIKFNYQRFGLTFIIGLVLYPLLLLFGIIYIIPLHYIYEWTLVPLGAPNTNLVQIFCILALIRLINPSLNDHTKEECSMEQIIMKFLFLILGPWITMGVVYLLYSNFIW